MSPKIAFYLEQNEDGYPPISVELLNATAVSDGLFRIENAPYFTKNISYHDVVQANHSSVNDQYDFSRVVEESTFTSISIIILDAAMDVVLMDILRGHDCVVEYGEFGRFRVLSVAVPATTDYGELRQKLQWLEESEQISFSELAVAHEQSWQT